MAHETPDCASCGAKEEAFYKFNNRNLCEPCMVEEEHVQKYGLWSENEPEPA